MRPTKLLAICALLACWAGSARAANLTCDDVADHVGQTATVCGVVASARYAEQSPSKPTFLNLCKTFPNQIITGFIRDSDRPKFGTPEKDLLGKEVCITGKIELYKGRAEIKLREAEQLKPK
jgi:hypothetical protein